MTVIPLTPFKNQDLTSPALGPRADRQYAGLSATIRTTVATMDLPVGVLALLDGAVLVTANRRHFANSEGLEAAQLLTAPLGRHPER
jgi:hypothetical protein